MRKKIRVALLLLPIFISLTLLSVSYAIDYEDIRARVRVVPAANTECFPNPLIVGSKEKVVVCYIELDTVHPKRILPNTLRLSLAERAVTPIPILHNSPNTIGDFDKDGKPDLKVTFNKTIVDSWFSDLYLPEDFTFNVTGEIQGIPDYTFVSIDIVKIIKPSYTFVYFNGKGGDVNAIKGIDLSKTNIKTSEIDRSGHQLVRFDKYNLVKKWEDIVGTVTGTVPKEILPGRYINLGFTVWLRYATDNCVFTPPSSLVCDGKGTLFKRGLAVGYSREDVDVHFETDGVKASLVGKQSGKIVFDQSNVPLTAFEYVVKTKSPFLFFG
jgi:hypothetical protein